MGTPELLAVALSVYVLVVVVGAFVGIGRAVRRHRAGVVDRRARVIAAVTAVLTTGLAVASQGAAIVAIACLNVVWFMTTMRAPSSTPAERLL